MVDRVVDHLDMETVALVMIGGQDLLVELHSQAGSGRNDGASVLELQRGLEKLGVEPAPVLDSTTPAA